MTDATFAIPGDLDQRTGGYIYEAAVLRHLGSQGCATDHLQLPGSFPDPSDADMVTSFELLAQVDTPIILDGFLVGALDPERLATLSVPLVGMVHHPLGLETGLSPQRSAFLMDNERRNLALMDHVVVPSPHTAAVLVSEFRVPEEMISIALPGFDRPTQTPCPVDPPLILSVGLLAERKGHDILLDALSMIKDLPWQAQIVGKAHDPVLAKTLVDQRDRLGLAARVDFAGELGETALADRFASASLFALATRYEGYGMVLSEAMLHGLPVVSCATGAVPDTVGAAGILAPVDDAPAFADAMRAVLADPVRRDTLRKAARDKASGLPSWADTAAIMADAVRRVSR